MSSSETSLSFSDSLDSFLDKLKPYEFEQPVSDTENTDREVRSSTMQTKEAEKERKRNLDWCLRGKCKATSVCAAVRKMKYWMKFFKVVFCISDYVIWILCIQKQAFAQC